MKIQKKWFYTVSIIFIIYVGTVLRFSLANIGHRTDSDGFVIDAKLFAEGKNIYLYQPYYNYSPLFFYILGGLSKLQKSIPLVPLKTMIHWLFTVVDIFTVFILIGLAKQRKTNILLPVILFFLNPVSVIISGFHGQFDNIAIAFLLLGIYLYRKSGLLLWFILSVGLTIKHTIVFPVFVVFMHTFKNFSRTLLAIFFALFFFGLSFLPFLPEAKNQIIENVFKYQSMTGLYGVSFFLSKLCTSCVEGGVGLIARNAFLLIVFVFIVFIRSRDVARTALVSFLAFLVFTTGIGGQYFVFPIALGALFPSIWFYVYTAFVTLFFLGNDWEFNISIFKIFSWNIVWITTLIWFLSELKLLLKVSSRTLKDAS